MSIFDKRTYKTWSARPDKCFCENRFNDPTRDRYEAQSPEKIHSVIESYAAPFIRSLLDGMPINSLSKADRKTLSIFIAALFLRSPSQRANHLARNRQLRSLFPDGALPEQFVEQHGTLTDGEAKDSSISMTFALATEIASHLWKKCWYLSTAYPGTPLLIGDSPVVLYNMIKHPSYGTLGFAVPGIEVHTPLSPSVLLSCVDPALVKQAAVRSPAMMKCLTHGTRLKLTPTNMVFFNSLQARWAERLVASSDADFRLVQTMVSENSMFKHSVRMQAMRGNEPMPEVSDWDPRILPRD